MSAALSGTLTDLLKRNRWHLQSWLIGWAAIIYLSALAMVIATQAPSGILGLAGQAFQVADQVPPFGKLSLGAAFAALMFLFGSTSRLGAAIAGAAAFTGILILPAGYYPQAYARPDLAMINIVCGGLGGLIAAILRKHWTHKAQAGRENIQ